MQITRIYAGVGSRETPAPILAYLRALAKGLAQAGFVLRSGAADGADAAFEAGCDAVAGLKEIWLPWRGFNGHADTGFYPSAAHAERAATVHPAWPRLGQGPQKLHARNVGQVLGAQLEEPVAFVVCWTKDGCETEQSRTRDTGGTGTAIVLAHRAGIPVFNLANTDGRLRLEAYLTANYPDVRLEALKEQVTLAPAINIWSGAHGLGGALTNMSERARERGFIKNAYPVRVNEVSFPDSEAAYQALKRPGDDAYNDGLMIDLIALKFEQHAILFDRVTQNGGAQWLGACSHFTQAKSARFQAWEGQGHDSRFIRNLVQGYLKALSGRGSITRVVHVKEAPFDVYIGRQMGNGSHLESEWHNPFKLKHFSREQVVEQYHDYLRARPDLMAKLHTLKGKTLGCWCKSHANPDALCHGDVLATLAEGKEWVLPEGIQQTLF